MLLIHWPSMTTNWWIKKAFFCWINEGKYNLSEVIGFNSSIRLTIATHNKRMTDNLLSFSVIDFFFFFCRIIHIFLFCFRINFSCEKIWRLIDETYGDNDERSIVIKNWRKMLKIEVEKDKQKQKCHCYRQKINKILW